MRTILPLAWFLTVVVALQAEFTLPAIIGDHMVLPQKQANPLWGWDPPAPRSR